jgi:hypothetical protein
MFIPLSRKCVGTSFTRYYELNPVSVWSETFPRILNYNCIKLLMPIFEIPFWSKRVTSNRFWNPRCSFIEGGLVWCACANVSTGYHVFIVRFKSWRRQGGKPSIYLAPPPPDIKNNKKFWEELTAYFPWYDTGHIENDASNNSSIVPCVFVTAVTFLPSRCLATIGIFIEPLLSKDLKVCYDGTLTKMINFLNIIHRWKTLFKATFRRLDAVPSWGRKPIPLGSINTFSTQF